MTEQMIHSIIDDIAHDAKIIISEHLHPECDDLVDALKQSAKDLDEVGEKTRKVFRDLEDDIRAYAEKNCVSITSGDDYAEDDECTEFGIVITLTFKGFLVTVGKVGLQLGEFCVLFWRKVSNGILNFPHIGKRRKVKLCGNNAEFLGVLQVVVVRLECVEHAGNFLVGSF